MFFNEHTPCKTFSLPICSLLLQVDQIRNHVVTQLLVNDPIHQLETREGDREDDPGILVNVRSRHSEHLVQLLHLVWISVGSRAPRGWRCGWRRGRGRWRNGGQWGQLVHRGRRRGRLGVVVVVPWAMSGHGRRRAVLAVAPHGAVSGSWFAVHAGVVDFEVNRLFWKEKKKEHVEFGHGKTMLLYLIK